MRKINLICVGKTQDAWLEKGIQLYQKKLRFYCDFSIQIIKEANYRSGKPSAWMATEAKLIDSKLSGSAMNILCDENGKQCDSVGFANHFQQWANRGHSQFNFVIGGAWGIDPTLKKKADFLFSVSQMTFTHQMIRLILSEQIYRAFTIIKGEKYHHV